MNSMKVCAVVFDHNPKHDASIGRGIFDDALVLSATFSIIKPYSRFLMQCSLDEIISWAAVANRTQISKVVAVSIMKTVSSKQEPRNKPEQSMATNGP